MFAGDPIVPIAKRLPFRTAVGRPAENIAFAGEDEIRVNGKFKIGQARFQQVDGPAGIYGPERALPLQRGDLLEAVGIEDGIAAVRDEGAVKIGAEKANARSHMKRLT
jgi:hypothetical protein